MKTKNSVKNSFKNALARRKQGFTFIEVALVLAIAGLIFAMTFVALPALWTSERDTDRRADVMGFINNLKNYQSNNSRGALPGTSSAEQKQLSDGGVITVNATDVDPPELTEVPAVSGANSDASWLSFYRDYLAKDGFFDPDGPSYDLMIMACKKGNSDGDGHSLCDNSALATLYNSTFKSSNYTMYVVTGATCYGETAIYSNNTRHVAALYRLESGGLYCENS